MAEIVASDIREILDIDDSLDLSPFITAAESLTDAHCSGLGSSLLKEVQRWLGAHFACIYEPRAANEKAGPVGQTNQSKVDLGLNVTHYGQQAMMLDSSGGLAKLNKATLEGKARTFTFHWAGSTD